MWSKPPTNTLSIELNQVSTQSSMRRITASDKSDEKTVHGSYGCSWDRFYTYITERISTSRIPQLNKTLLDPQQRLQTNHADQLVHVLNDRTWGYPQCQRAITAHKCIWQSPKLSAKQCQARQKQPKRQTHCQCQVYQGMSCNDMYLGTIIAHLRQNLTKHI